MIISKHLLSQFSRSVWLFVTPWTAAHQASLSITNSRNLLNSCPLSRWCHPTISSSVTPFSFRLQSFPTSGSFQMRCLLLGRKVMTKLDSILKSRDITLPTKVHLVKAMVFPVVMYGCESWTIRKPERWRIDGTAVLEKTLESPLNCKEIQPVHPKGDQSWIFIGRTDAEAETPILWPLDAKSWLIWRRLKTSAIILS